MIQALQAKKASVERKIAFYEDCIASEKAKLGLIDEMIGDEMKANAVVSEAVATPAVSDPIVVSYGVSGHKEA